MNVGRALHRGAWSGILALSFLCVAVPSKAEEGHRAPCVASAHRGIRELGADNSVQAIRGAMSAKIPFIELDVRQIQDGSLHLFHDRHLREGNYIGPSELRGRSFDSLSPMELASIRLPDRSEVLTLATAIDEVGDHPVTLMLDMKGEEVIAPRVLQEIAARHAERRVLIQCQTSACVEQVKKTAPTIRVLARVHSQKGLHDALALKPEYIQVDREADLREAYQKAHQQGTRVVVKALGDASDIPSEWRRLCAAGVSIVLTDHPREFERETRGTLGGAALTHK